MSDIKADLSANHPQRPPADAISQAIVPSGNHLPTPLQVPGRRAGRRWTRLAAAVAVVLLGIGGATYWWTHRQPPLPPGIGWGNGRIEADPIDIDTKYAARIAELLVDEGDMVTAGQVMARMDTRDLQASLQKSEALVRQAQKAVNEAHANVEQQQSQVVLANQEMRRARDLLAKGWVTQETFDQRTQQLNSANAALIGAQSRETEAQHALEAATHDVEFYKVEIAEGDLVAPRDGRIQYRIANVGEVLPAGGRVFTMLDVSYVYMDIYLPTQEAGRIKIGTDSRIVLDAYPNHPIPAKVIFIATAAQFTLKTVETHDERDRLMFRVRVRIDPERLRAHADAVRSGLPGVAYVKWEPDLPWPTWLQGKVSQ